MTAPQPYFPAEIVDNIVETTLGDYYSETSEWPVPTLPVPSAIALVSHRFRYHVNSRRFSSISVQREIALARLHALVDLMTSATWTEVNGIAHLVTHLHLHLDRMYESLYQNILPEFDGVVVVLLNLIFRGFDIPAATNTAYTLSLYGRNTSRALLIALLRDKTPYFGPKITHALHDLLYNSLLTRVWLHRMGYIPHWSLFSSPTITFLSIDQFLSDTAPPYELGTLPVLASLKELELHSSPRRFLDVVSRSFEDVVPVLKKVASDVLCAEDFWALVFLGKKLNTLRLKLQNMRGGYTTIFDYSAFVSLQELYVEYGLNTLWNDAQSSSDHPLFLSIPNSLPETFPPSVFIRIDSKDINSQQPVHNSINRIYGLMYHPRLEEFLAQKCSSSSIEMLITFCLYKPSGVFDAKEAEAYARSVFSTLYAVKGLKLDMRVYVRDASVYY